MSNRKAPEKLEQLTELDEDQESLVAHWEKDESVRFTVDIATKWNNPWGERTLRETHQAHTDRVPESESQWSRKSQVDLLRADARGDSFLIRIRSSHPTESRIESVYCVGYRGTPARMPDGAFTTPSLPPFWPDMDHHANAA